MPYEFKMTRMVEFAETDMAGIMHFSNYFRFMEATEHAFFRALGASVHSHASAAMRGWARVHAECHYTEPLRYQDVVEVHLLVREKKPKAISYDFVFRRTDGSEGHDDAPLGRAVAHGSITAVCVEQAAGATSIRSVPMPAEIAEKIEVAPPEVLETLEALLGEGP